MAHASDMALTSDITCAPDMAHASEMTCAFYYPCLYDTFTLLPKTSSCNFQLLRLALGLGISLLGIYLLCLASLPQSSSLLTLNLMVHTPVSHSWSCAGVSRGEGTQKTKAQKHFCFSSSYIPYPRQASGFRYHGDSGESALAKTSGKGK